MVTQTDPFPDRGTEPHLRPAVADPALVEPAVGVDTKLSDLVGRATRDIGDLFHNELELAKVEIKDEVRQATKAGAMFGGAAVAGLFALLLLLFAAAWGLAEIIPVGFAFLAVGAVVAIVAGALAMAGRNRAKTIDPVPQQTVDTLKEDVQWARARKH